MPASYERSLTSWLFHKQLGHQTVVSELSIVSSKNSSSFMLKSSFTFRRHRNFTEDEEHAKASHRAKTLKDLKGETFDVYLLLPTCFHVSSRFRVYLIKKQ